MKTDLFFFFFFQFVHSVRWTSAHLELGATWIIRAFILVPWFVQSEIPMRCWSVGIRKRPGRTQTPLLRFTNKNRHRSIDKCSRCVCHMHRRDCSHGIFTVVPDWIELALHAWYLGLSLRSYGIRLSYFRCFLVYLMLWTVSECISIFCRQFMFLWNTNTHLLKHGREVELFWLSPSVLEEVWVCA